MKVSELILEGRLLHEALEGFLERVLSLLLVFMGYKKSEEKGGGTKEYGADIGKAGTGGKLDRNQKRNEEGQRIWRGHMKSWNRSKTGQKSEEKGGGTGGIWRGHRKAGTGGKLEEREKRKTRKLSGQEITVEGRSKAKACRKSREEGRKRSGKR
jgi:hypothetical protein